MVKHGSIDKVYHATFFLLKEKVPSILRSVLKKCIRRAYWYKVKPLRLFIIVLIHSIIQLLKQEPSLSWLIKLKLFIIAFILIFRREFIMSRNITFDTISYCFIKVRTLELVSYHFVVVLDCHFSPLHCAYQNYPLNKSFILSSSDFLDCASIGVF